MKKSQQPDFTYDPVKDKKQAGKRAIDFVYTPKSGKTNNNKSDGTTKGGLDQVGADKKNPMDTEIINLNNPKPKKKR